MSARRAVVISRARASADSFLLQAACLQHTRDYLTPASARAFSPLAVYQTLGDVDAGGVAVTEPSSDGDQEIDPEVFQLAAKIFDLARHGNTDTCVAYVDAGVPVNLSNDRGE